jgi:DNA-binding NarL/FixJ family response regulator
MRVLLVGPPADRDRLREQLVAAGIDVAGEFPTLAAARDAGRDADAVMLATGTGRSGAVAEPLTPREVQVVELLVQGMSNKTIAAGLGISDQTVKFHVAAICGKLGAANRTDAVRLAIRRGIVAV